MAKIGSLITISNIRNGADRDLPFYGINKDKLFVPTVAATDGLDRKNYKVVTKGRFVFSGMQTGRDMCIRIGMYDNDFDCLVSPAYTTFDVTSDEVLPEYLFMFFNSEEKNRYGAFLSDGSVRANLDWDVFCNIEIPLPGIEVQREYVAVYKAMQHNLNAMQNKLDDLKLVCDAYIEQLRQQYPLHKIGKYITEVDERNNIGLCANSVRGLATTKELIETKADMENVGVDNYKLLRPNMIAFVSDTSRRGDKMSMGFNDTTNTYLLSSISTVFRTDEERLLPKYLMLYLTRPEFDRYARYHSWGSARETFTWEDMCDVEIPIPPIEVQKSIVAIYDVYNRRKQYAERLRQMINEMCPILVAASVGDTAVAAAHS